VSSESNDGGSLGYYGGNFVKTDNCSGCHLSLDETEEQIERLRSGSGRDTIVYRGIKNGKPYTGIASAPSSELLTDEQILARRYGGNFSQFGNKAPQIVYRGNGMPGKATARGLEQSYYEADVAKFGRGGVANQQNPVGPKNNMAPIYRWAAKFWFGIEGV